MKKVFIFLGIFILSYINLLSQNLEDVGAGVIDFLLRNPKTANRMNTSEAVALDIIGDLLKTSSERKHELKYAEAGSNKVIINSNNRHAEIVRDINGRIYLLVDGIIYPISNELVQQAKASQSQQTTYNNYSVNKSYLVPYDINEIKRADRVIKSDNKICTVVTCNNIIHGTFFSLARNCQNMKKIFYKNENIYAAIRYNTHKNKKFYRHLVVLRIYDSNNKFVLERRYDTKPKQCLTVWWSFKLSPGIYSIHAILCNNNNEYIPIGEMHKVVKIQITR